MPNDEDPMPLDGNPHPLPGNLLQDNLLFVLPPYPMLGWNDAPVAPPPPPENNIGDAGWGNANWGDNEDDLQQPPQPAVPEQDQVSIVIDQPEGSGSVEQHVEVQFDEQHQFQLEQQLQDNVQPAVLENPLAIVPYQPPVIHQHQIFIGMARIVAGPPLPPEMIWKRSFENLLPEFAVKEVPRPIFFKPLGTVTYSKRTWTIAFDDSQKMSLLVPSLPSNLTLRKSIVAKRPVARALFGGSPEEVLSANDDAVSEEVFPEDVVSSSMEENSFSSSVVFSADSQANEKKQTRRRKTVAPLVDTSVRRCTRSAAKLDGFKPVSFEQLSLQPTKRRPRSKPIELKAQPNPDDAGDNGKSEVVPPSTPLNVLQTIGAELEIDPNLLSKDKLMANPKDDSSSGV
ncbi:uncharacterized protein [Aegilops tauschii subsp. strangulata]|uniref:uncharacterized protein n=1 Tax=Aegilops tauschii subsp. strangulata TaxID=200361 RepID=UPI003CC88634